jgi:hypothetical protein
MSHFKGHFEGAKTFLTPNLGVKKVEAPSKCPEKWLIKLLSPPKNYVPKFLKQRTLVILCTRVLLCTVVVCCCLLLGVLVCCCVFLCVRGVRRSPGASKIKVKNVNKKRMATARRLIFLEYLKASFADLITLFFS